MEKSARVIFFDTRIADLGLLKKGDNEKLTATVKHPLKNMFWGWKLIDNWGCNQDIIWRLENIRKLEKLVDFRPKRIENVRKAKGRHILLQNHLSCIIV